MTHALIYALGPDGWRERIEPVTVLPVRETMYGFIGPHSWTMRLEIVRRASGEEVRVAAERLGTPEELGRVLASVQPPRRSAEDPVPLRERFRSSDAEVERLRRYRTRDRSRPVVPRYPPRREHVQTVMPW